jgi:hypothetical protein
MKKILLTKKWSIFPVLLLSLSSCFGQYRLINSQISDIAKFEIGFIEYYINQYKTIADSDSSITVHLFGFKEDEIDERWMGKLREHAQTGDLQEFIGSHTYVFRDTTCCRTYIALEKSGLEYEGKYYTANSKGVVKFENSVALPKIRIRYIKTVFGGEVPGEFKIASIYQYANRQIIIYDLGDKWISSM